MTVIISIGESMKSNYSENKTRLEFAKESATLLLRQKLLFNPNDHFSLIVIGSEDQTDFNYPNIKYLKSLGPAGLETFDQINKIEINESETEGDCKQHKLSISFSDKKHRICN